MTSLRHRLIVLAGCLALLAALSAAGAASATSSGDVYGGSGDWTVNNPTSYDGETVTITGIVDLYSDLVVDDSTFTFDVAGGALYVHSGASITLRNSTVDTSDASYYFIFAIEDGAATSYIYDSTLDHVDGGLFITGGAHDIANTAISHGLGYGVRLLDSNSALTGLSITVDTVEAFTVVSTSIIEPCYTNQWDETYCYSHYFDNKTWSARAIGVEAVGGAPSVDTIDISITDVYSTVYADMGGHYDHWLDFQVYPYVQEYNYYNEFGTAGLEIYGFRGVDAAFTKFTEVAPTIDNVNAEVHATIVVDSCWNYNWGWSVESYCYDYESYYHNYLSLSSTVVSVYLENAGLANIDGLDLTMGSVDITFYNDWNPSWAFASTEWEDNYITFGASQIFGLYSVERVVIATPQAVTPTSVTISNSILRRAGVRADRIYTYTPSSVNTTFRGTILIDNVTVLESPAAGVVLNVDGTSTATFQSYDYTVEVKDSTFDGARAFALYVRNKPDVSTSYKAAFDIHDNTIINGSVRSGTNFDGIIIVDTGGHVSSLAGDTYQVDFRMRNNAISNIRGPLFGFDYSNYKFQGGAILTMENNTFESIEPFTVSYTEAFIKTNMDTIVLRNNSFADFLFVYGILGGEIGSDDYYEWSYYFYGYTWDVFPRSWPYKTPTIIVDANMFNHVEQQTSSTYSIAWFNIAGRGHVNFTNNVINDSAALWLNAVLNFDDYYKFPTEDIEVNIIGNRITNHTDFPFARYLDPYKSGQAVRMVGNFFSDSDQVFFSYEPSQTWNMPAFWKATMVLEDNQFYNITGDAVRLTGSSTVVNNTWDGVSGWALQMDMMRVVPALASNSVRNSANGYSLKPVIISGIVSTTTFTNLIIDVTGTGILMESGNMLIFDCDFGQASIAVEVHDGYAEVYSSAIRILAGRVAGEASIEVFNDVGFSVHWADASGSDSGVSVSDALVIMFTSANQLSGSGRSDAAGLVAPKSVEIWKMVSFGSLASSEVFVPFNVLSTKSGITTQFQLPSVPPGGTIDFFEDYPDYPVLLLDNVVPTISIGSPLPGETVGSTTVAIAGYTFERGSGVSTQRLRVDDGAWIDIPTGSSTWTVTLSGVSEGRHTIFAEVSDVATNAFAAQVEFFVDVTPPVLTLSSPLEDLTLTNQPVFDVRGHVTPESSQVALNGITLAVNSRGDFFFNHSLSDGLNVLRFTATDRAGNQVIAVRTIEFDRYAPFLQVDAPVNGLLTNQRTVDVVGRSERNAFVTVNGLPAFVNPIDGTFVLPEVLLDDLFDQTENLLVIRAVDPAGNTRFENRTVIVDTKAPSIELDLDPAVRSDIEAARPISASTLNVKGTTDSNDAVITVAGQEVPLAGLSFSRVLVLREGLNVIEIASMDDAGNAREVTLRVTRDTVRPTLTLVTPAETTLLTNQTTLLVSGYTDTPDSIVSIVYTDARGIRVTDAVPTVPVGLPVRYMFEYTLVLNPDGNAHAVEVRATDGAGNFDTETFTYTAKVGKPFLEVIGFQTRTSVTFVWINGTTEAGIDKVRINGQDFDVVGQYFSVRWQLPITHGNYTFTVSVRDPAGNENVWTNRTQVDVPVEVQTQAPSGGIPLVVQVGIGTALLSFGIAALFVAVSRSRRDVD